MTTCRAETGGTGHCATSSTSARVASWPEREIRLSEVLGEFLSVGARLHVVTNTHAANGPFAYAMQNVAETLDAHEHLRFSSHTSLTSQEEERLHRKRLVTERLMIWGSMNFTRSGLERNAEDVSLELEPSEVARAVNEMEQLYGRPWE